MIEREQLQGQEVAAHHSMSASRWDDCVVRVVQDNSNHMLMITGLNEAAQELLGYYSDELDGKNLGVILSDEVRQELQEDLDYVAGGVDLAQVLRKYNRFEIRNKNGDMVPVTLSVFYILSNRSYLQFELLMRDATIQTAMRALYQDIYQKRKRGELAGDELGMPNREVFLRTVELVRTFLSVRGIRAVVGVMILEDYQFIKKNRGQEGVDKITTHVAEEFKRRCRDEDMIAYLGDGRLGAVLFDCSIEDAANAFARIHRGMTAQPYILDNQKAMPIQISIAYQEITKDQMAEVVMKHCADQAVEFAGQGGNIIRRVR